MSRLEAPSRWYGSPGQYRKGREPGEWPRPARGTQRPIWTVRTHSSEKPWATSVQGRSTAAAVAGPFLRRLFRPSRIRFGKKGRYDRTGKDTLLPYGRNWLNRMSREGNRPPPRSPRLRSRTRTRP